LALFQAEFVNFTQRPAGCRTTVCVQAIAKANEKEAARDLKVWTYEGLPEKLLDFEPQRGSIVEEKHLESLDATELLLSNGMRVTFRRSDLMQDQVLLSVRPCWPCFGW
jgi:hypothetical protein